MKTVLAEIVSSKPISLSRAAKFLSNFVECDNGASRAISTYLRQTSDAFNELSEFHKKLKSSCSDRKSNHSHASPGISNVQIEHSSLSAQSSEGRKRKGKNRKEEADIGVNDSESVLRNSLGVDSENGFAENLTNSVKDNFEAVTNKKQKKKHAQKVRDDESAENGAGEKGVSEGKYEDSVPIELGKEVAADLPESGVKKSKNEEKGDEGHDSLPPNGISKGGGEFSEAKSVSEESKREKKKKKKRKIEEAAVSSELLNVSMGHRSKKAKKRMAD